MQPLEIQTGIKEECGVFGIYDPEGGSISTDIYYGLSALQHRGRNPAESPSAIPRGRKGWSSAARGWGWLMRCLQRKPSKI